MAQSERYKLSFDFLAIVPFHPLRPWPLEGAEVREQSKNMNNRIKLLGIGTDAKTVKGEKKGYLTGILYLAPHTVAGPQTVCPFSTKECRAACLYSAGRGGFTSVQKARIAKTTFWRTDPDGFVKALAIDISALVRKAKKLGMIPAVRLNGTSDIKWEETGIMAQFPDVQFYDYTKFPPSLRKNLPANYHLTYSFTGLPLSSDWSAQWAARGVNTAVVFRGGLPTEFLGRAVVDGDLSDLRFNDERGVIVGLKAKGAARKGISSFIQEVNQ